MEATASTRRPSRWNSRQPVMRAGQQEAFHLVAAVVEDVRAPVLVQAQARVFVLVQRGAVEARQRPGIRREMRRHPVEDHADAGLVAGIDKGPEIVGVPKRLVAAK